jgi:putative ABC transport system permease protein
MFWRLLLQLMRASRARLALALAAVAGGAAVVSALLNLQFDAEHKLTQEFRTLGANVVVGPGESADAAGQPSLMDVAVLERIAAARGEHVVAVAPYLFVVARAGTTPVIVAGTWLDQVRKMSEWWQVEGEWLEARDSAATGAHCLVGHNVALQLNLAPGGTLELRYADRSQRLAVAGIVTTGGAEDSQVFTSLPVAQQLAALPGRISLVQLSVQGAPDVIHSHAGRLATALPGFNVRPIRQLAEAEGQLLARIRLLILATVMVILALTALCVLATMAALAMEHRRDVGLMKALGGPMARVVRVFLTEVGLLAIAGGGLGWAAGMGLSEWMGRSIFGASISPGLEVLPLTVALMLAVALAGALPLRLLSHVRPAAILRGE